MDPAAAAEWRQGWRIVVAATVGVGLSVSSLQTYSFGVLVKPIGLTLGWTRAQTTGIHFFIALASMIGAPLFGSLIDRVGPRRVALGGIPVAAAAYACLSGIGPSLAQFYGLAFIVGLLAAATGPIVWTRAVSGWFQINRGLALACTLAGTGVFALLGPPAVTRIVAEFGWRAVFVTLAGMMLLSWIPTKIWFFERPRPVSAPSMPAARRRPVDPAESADLSGITLREALASGRFWLIASGLLLASVGATAMVAHLVPMLTDKGIPASAAAWVASVLGLSVVGGRLLAGWLLDRLPTGWVCALLMGSAAVGCLTMLSFDGVHLLTPVLVAILVGLAAGGEVDLIAYLTAKYFGMAAYGRIFGMLYACFSLGAGTSPVLAGFLFDRSGNYQRALLLLAIAFAGSALLLGSLGRKPGIEAGRPMSRLSTPAG